MPAHDHHHHDDHDDHHAHDHGHAHHHHAHLTGRKLAIATAATVAILVVLSVGGYLANSLALLADAGHVVTDIAALALSWYATWQATRPADDRRTFGYHRTGILAALINALSLILIALFIAYEAYHRFATPPTVEPVIMVVTAAIGMVLNLGIAFGLRSESETNLNVRSAFLHVVGDAAASGGVIVGAGLIWATGIHAIDPLLSVAIAAFIAHGAWRLMNESVAILMEGVPPDVNLGRIVADLRTVEGVKEVHDLHVWSITSQMPSLSCHVLIEDAMVPQSVAVVAACNHLLESRYGITHTTIQAEAERCSLEGARCTLSLVQSAETSHHH